MVYKNIYMVLKTHLFIKNISFSLQKLLHYNKSLTKHQKNQHSIYYKPIKITKELKL